MKTAISLPDETFHAANAAAQRLGISRSELFRRALEAWLATSEREAITRALDEVYVEPAPLDEALLRAQVAALPDEDW